MTTMFEDAGSETLPLERWEQISTREPGERGRPSVFRCGDHLRHGESASDAQAASRRTTRVAVADTDSGAPTGHPLFGLSAPDREPGPRRATCSQRGAWRAHGGRLGACGWATPRAGSTRSVFTREPCVRSAEQRLHALTEPGGEVENVLSNT